MSSYDEFPPNEEMRRVLLKHVMERNWEGVESYCSQWCWLCGEKITMLGNTALHFAVCESNERVVGRLVGIIENRFTADGAVEALSIRNTEGNTPLHLAVIGGNFEICRCICDRRPQLLGVRNNEGETPLFLAARMGEMDALIRLLCRDTQNIYVNIRNNKGDTVLHSAISGEHWKLAHLVLQSFEHLSINRNEEGATPLHLLAEKPGAFRSGTYLSLFDKLIYHLIPLFPGYYKDKTSSSPTESTGKHSPPESDASDALPQYMIDVIERRCDSAGDGKEESNSGRSSFPPNYDTCVPFISLVNKAIMPCVKIWITWLKRQTWMKGQNHIQKIKKKKETNLLSVLIMSQLLELQKFDELEKRGWNPKYTAETNTFAARKNEQADLSSGLTDVNSAQTQTDEGSNLAVMFKVDKDEPRPDGVFVRAIGGVPAAVVAQSSADAECLVKELRRNKGQEKDGVGSGQTPILLAAKNGITEMVQAILEISPVAIYEVDIDMKNAVLLAVENRQPRVCQVLLEKYGRESSLFRAVDKDGCNALHLVAKFSDNQRQFIPSAALQMQCEVLWFEYVKNCLMPKYFPSRNFIKETAEEMFTDHHKKLMEKGTEWLNSTSNSCSLVATIIATVVFATSITVPGGVRNDNGKPYLEHHLPFRIFAVSSLVALCFSVTSTVIFLAILTSRHQERDFGKDLPWKLLLGLTTLLISILAMLVNFCSSHFFVLQDELKMAAALPVYAVICLPATYFAVAQLPYFDLLWTTFSKVPRHWMKKDV